MYRVYQIFMVTGNNFRRWHKNPRIFITFAFAFILCFLLSDKAMQFAQENGTTLQFMEAFIWTFGDSNSILLSSLLLLLLFADMPFITTATTFLLVRINRRTFILGQGLYIFLSTCVYMTFMFLATTIVCMQNSFLGNKWSETAALLGYSGAGEKIAIPSFVKVMQLSRPYQCMANIFLLMLLYALVLAFIMLLGNLKKGPGAGVASVLVFSLFGFMLNPELIQKIFHLSEALKYKANVAVGWISPLNQATYYMHNFGFDLLPRVWQSYLIFTVLIILLFMFILREMKKFSFNFTGTEG